MDSNISVIMLPFLVGIAMLNRTLILSYVYPVKRFSSHASLLALVEVSSTLFTLAILARWSKAKHTRYSPPYLLVVPSFILALIFVFSHALFSTTPTLVSILITIVSLVLAFIAQHSSCSVYSKFMYPTAATLCMSVIGIITLYSSLLSFSILFIIIAACLLPALLLRTTTISELLTLQSLAIAFGVLCIFSPFVELVSKPYMEYPKYNGFLLAINAAMATFNAHYLSVLNITTSYTIPLLFAAPLLSLVAFGIPQDLFSVYPMYTSTFVPLAAISSIVILGFLLKGNMYSQAAGKKGPADTEVPWDKPNDSLSSFSSGTSFISILSTSNEMDSPGQSAKGIHDLKLVASQLSWKWLFILAGITSSVLASIVSQYMYIPNIPGADPCSQMLFSQKQPLKSNGTQVLVTGGAGFIGSNLAEMLLDLGYKVRVLDNLATGSFANIVHLQDNPNFEFVIGDITLRQDVQKAMVGIEYVYHLAAMSKVVPSLQGPTMSKYFMDTNAGGSFTVLDVSWRAKVKKVVYAASSTYYGDGNLSMHEDSRADLLTPYASSKYEGEIQMDIFDRIFKQPTISLRFFVVYGPRQPTSGVYAVLTDIFAGKMRDHASLPIEEDGTHFHDFIHVRDIGTSLILAQQSELHGLVINSGTGSGHSVHEVADLVLASQRQVTPRHHNLVGTLANTCRAKMLLGFEAKHNFVTKMSSIIADVKYPEHVPSRPEFQKLVQKLRASPWLLPTNLLVHLYLPHSNDLVSAANASKEVIASLYSKLHDDGKKLVVIPFTKKLRASVENSFYTLVRYGQVSNILLVASLSEDLDECISMQTACYNANGLPFLNVIWKLLDAGWTVHVAQPGTAYLRAVWPSVMGLLDTTGAAMIVPHNKNQGSILQHYTATPSSLSLFSSLSKAKGDPDAINMVYKNTIGLCKTRLECTDIAKSSTMIPITLFSAPYSCLLLGSSNFPTPSSLCTHQWEHTFYMDAACVSKTLVTSLTKVQAWFMAPGTCHIMADSCAGIPSNLLHQPDPWTDQATCMGMTAKLEAVEATVVSKSPHEGRQSVLVIGGAGFIGSHLIRSLINYSPNLASTSSFHVTVLDNLSSAGIASIAGLIQKKDMFSFVYGSVNNLTVVSKALELSQATIIVHLGMVQPKNCKEACAIKLVLGTKTILDVISDLLVSKKLSSLPRLIFGSSSDVYGHRSDHTVSGATRKESSLVSPATSYATGLLYAEGMVIERSQAMGISSIILRVFPVYGPSAIPSPLDKSVLRWSGNGIGLRNSPTTTAIDWVHVGDVVQAIILSIKSPHQWTGSILNVGAGRLETLLDSGAIANGSKKMQPISSQWVANLDMITEKLGYKPRFSLEPLAAEPPVHDHPEFKPMVDALTSAPWLLPLGLLRNKMMGLRNDLAKIAKYASKNTFKLSIVPYQLKYRQMTENTLHTLIQNGHSHNTMLFAFDNETAEECLWWNFPCYNASSLSVANFNQKNKYSNYTWAAISWTKPRLVSKLLDLGYSVHLSDSDIGYVRQVWSSYESYMDEVGADMSLVYEVSADFVANTGNYLFRPTQQVKDFMARYNAIGDKNATISDQHAFAIVFRELGMDFCQTRADCKKMHTQGYPAIRYHSSTFGRALFKWCPRDIDTCKPDVLYIHPICLKIDEKQPAIEKYDAWYMAKEDVPYYCLLKPRIGSARCPGIPHALLEGKSIHEFKVSKCAGSVAKLTDAD